MVLVITSWKGNRTAVSSSPELLSFFGLFVFLDLSGVRQPGRTCATMVHAGTLLFQPVGAGYARPH